MTTEEAMAAALEADADRLEAEAAVQARYKNHEALNEARMRSAKALRDLAKALRDCTAPVES
jgi:hypothetical protein